MTNVLPLGIPGFYGKAVNHGDFLLRGLPPPFIAAWDAWLQEELHGSRERLGSSWLDRYLCFPVWRFALAPGICGDSGWTGVMMPSVDRVGRYFPMTVAACCPPDAQLASLAVVAPAWYAALDDIARSCLRMDYSADAMEARLRGLPPIRMPYTWTPYTRPAQPGAGSFWWTQTEHSETRVDHCAGLPAGPRFLDILNGGPARGGE